MIEFETDLLKQVTHTCCMCEKEYYCPIKGCKYAERYGFCSDKCCNIYVANHHLPLDVERFKIMIQEAMNECLKKAQQ